MRSMLIAVADRDVSSLRVAATSSFFRAFVLLLGSVGASQTLAQFDLPPPPPADIAVYLDRTIEPVIVDRADDRLCYRARWAVLPDDRDRPPAPPDDAPETEAARLPERTIVQTAPDIPCTIRQEVVRDGVIRVNTGRDGRIVATVPVKASVEVHGTGVIGELADMRTETDGAVTVEFDQSWSTALSGPHLHTFGVDSSFARDAVRVGESITVHMGEQAELSVENLLTGLIVIPEDEVQGLR